MSFNSGFFRQENNFVVDMESLIKVFMFTLPYDGYDGRLIVGGVAHQLGFSSEWFAKALSY